MRTHGDSLIVEEIRDRYLGKVDAIFLDEMVTLNSVQTLLLWEGIHAVKGNMGLFMLVIQNVW